MTFPAGRRKKVPRNFKNGVPQEAVSRYPFSKAKPGSTTLGAILLYSLVISGAFLFSGEARADFRVCNGTQQLVGVAIGYRANDGWVTEGWWQVPATTCATLIEGELQSRYYYLYAEDAAKGGRWTGDINMCVAENEFKIAGVQDCFARGFQRMGFKEYDTGRQGSWMVQLSDTPGTQESQN
ncbi:putative membrane protein [Sinorhizobium fredii]